MWGGALLLVAALGQTAYWAVYPLLSWQSQIVYLPAAVIPTLVLAALIVFAVGVRGGGSVVGKSVVGRISLIGFGACHAYAGWFEFLGLQLSEPLAYGLIVAPVLGSVLLIVSVTVIAWRGALPSPWRFAPALIVSALIARYWHALVVQEDAVAFISIDASVIVAQLLLGILSLFLSFRVARLPDNSRSSA
ncbi:hypothetical protein ASF87_06940 [Microbacterium sp. Leaf161]|nr:hypothetical protein ASF87_06940 [Microbacterium sp. Leaf161]